MSDPTGGRPPWKIDPGAEAGLSARLGENVRMLRARAHVSQEELAFRADIHRTQVSLIESGTRTPRIGTAIKLAAALEVDLTTLLHGISYEPVLFSATRGRFRISDRPLFDLDAATRSDGGATDGDR